jgi:hypothetical protein
MAVAGSVATEALVDAVEVGRRLSMRPGAVTRLAATGRIPRVVVSRKVIRFRWSAVCDALGIGTYPNPDRNLVPA